MSRTTRLLIGTVAGAAAGLVVNLAIGATEPWLAWLTTNVTLPLGKLFLRLLFMIVVPLLFSALVIGVCELDLKQVVRTGLRMFGYTIVVSAIAVLIGLVLVNAIQPGVGMPPEVREIGQRDLDPATLAPVSVVDTLLGMVPDNPIKAAAQGDMLGLIVFSLIFGVMLALTATDAARRLQEVIQGLYDVMMKLIDAVMLLAPVGVGMLLFTMTARLGVDVFVQLGAYVGVVLLGLGLHMFVVYPISVRVLAGMSPIFFFRESRAAIVTAFSTASSSATLPTALKVAEENLKLPPQVARFVLTAGSAMNQNGTALFEGVTVLFLAQVYAVELTLTQQAVVMIICILGGVGTAGVPAGSLPVIAMILGMVGIPPEGLGLILGVDRLLDMCRTTLNVTGDLAAAVYVAKGESSK